MFDKKGKCPLHIKDTHNSFWGEMVHVLKTSKGAFKVFDHDIYLDT